MKEKDRGRFCAVGGRLRLQPALRERRNGQRVVDCGGEKGSY